jgi:exonuclease III
MDEIVEIDSNTTLVNSKGRRISVRCWNVNGCLATNLSHPAFQSDLSKYDINYFQETHLLPSQELTLPLPAGYDVFAVAREPSNATFDRPWGGVLAMVRKDLDAEWDQILSGPDLLVLKIGLLSLFNTYVLPHGSPWTQWAQIAPN